LVIFDFILYLMDLHNFFLYNFHSPPRPPLRFLTPLHLTEICADDSSVNGPCVHGYKCAHAFAYMRARARCAPPKGNDTSTVAWESFSEGDWKTFCTCDTRFGGGLFRPSFVISLETRSSWTTEEGYAVVNVFTLSWSSCRPSHTYSQWQRTRFPSSAPHRRALSHLSVCTRTSIYKLF
jgi:hypothetical protein